MERGGRGERLAAPDSPSPLPPAWMDLDNRRLDRAYGVIRCAAISARCRLIRIELRIVDALLYSRCLQAQGK